MLAQYKKTAVTLLGAMLAVTPAFAQPQEPQEKIPYDLPVLKYEDKEFDLAYFVYYENNNLREIPRIDDEDERIELVDSAIEDMIFDHLLIDEIKDQGFEDSLEFKANNRLMEAQTLFKLYFRNQFQEEYKPDQEVLRARYEENKESYFEPPKFSFRHIFFKTIDEPQEVKEQALERAEKALALIEGGSDFVKVAEEMSDADTKGKVVGPFKPREYDEENAINPILEEALLDLFPGKYTDIIETRYGYQILKLETYEPKGYKDFSEVVSTIERDYRMEQRDKWLNSIVEDNWDEAISNYDFDVLFDEDAGGDAVIFEVYGKPYTKAEWEEVFGSFRERYLDLSEEERRAKIEDHLKNTIIQNLIGGHLARELGYEAIPSYQYLTKTYRARAMSDKRYEQLEEQYFEENPITMEEKREYYEQNKKRFRDPVENKVGMITINYPEHDEEVKYEIYKAQQAAREKAEDVIKRLQEGEDFATIAKEVSQDEYAEQGGDVGVVHLRMEDESLRDVARDIQTVKEGQFSDKPKKKGKAYRVYMNYDELEPTYKPFDDPEVQQQLDDTLRNRKSFQYKRDLMAQRVDQDKIEILSGEIYNLDFENIESVPSSLPDEPSE